MSKHVLVIVGSNRKGGNSDLLANALIEGIEENGNTATRITPWNLHGCIGCEQCRASGISGNCVTKDDMELIYEQYPKADVIVFVSPIYFWHVTAQTKMVMDRLYAIGSPLRDRSKETAMILCAADDGDVFDLAVEHYKYAVVGQLYWKDRGVLTVPGVWEAGDVKNTDGLQRAKALGRSL